MRLSHCVCWTFTFMNLNKEVDMERCFLKDCYRYSCKLRVAFACESCTYHSLLPVYVHV